MEIIIKKATLRNGLFLNYEFVQQDKNSVNTIKTSSDAPVHEDLQKCFRRLIPHFAFIAEEIDEELAKKAIDDFESYLLVPFDDAPEPKLYNFECYEVSISDVKGLNFVSIFGSKKLSTTETISFKTPSVDLDSLNDYKFVQELSNLIELLKSEVKQYMDGKHSERKQMEMFSEEEEEDLIEEKSAFGDSK